MSIASISSIAASARLAASVLALSIALQPMDAQQRPVVRVPISVLERYVGEYVYPAGTTVTVRLEGDTLIQQAGPRRTVMVPITATRFKMGPAYEAEFVIDEAGRVTKIITDGVDAEFRLPRKGDGASAPSAPPSASSAPAAATVRVPRSVLERYVGVYEYMPGQMKRTDLRIVVRLRGDTLTRQMGQGEVVLTPISETRFRVGSTSLTVEFVIDEAGVTQVLGAGGQQMLARLTSKR